MNLRNRVLRPVWSLLLLAVFAVHAVEPKISDIRLEPDGRARVTIAADASSYYVLYRGEVVTDIRLVSQLGLGSAGSVQLTDSQAPAPAAARFYRVEQVPLSAPKDSDGDGIDDVYELQRRAFLDPLVKIDPAQDTDADGVADLEEYRQNTDPAVANSVAPIVSLLAPTLGAAYFAPGYVTFAATAQAKTAGATVAKVEFFANTNKVGDGTPLTVAGGTQYEFKWDAVPLGDYVLSARVTDSKGASAESIPSTIRVVNLTVEPLTTLASSPAAGESGVAVTRETVLRFSCPLRDDAHLSLNRFNATANGRRILSRVELSTDHRTATLFYLENLPSSSRVRVTFDGTGVYDCLGRAIDADGDGVAGGVALIEFDTLATMAVARTAVIGRVFASEPVPGATGTNFVNRPLKGVTITVDGAEETLRAVTDAQGGFRLEPAPAGGFFVHVDGRTADGSQWPNGAYYPFVGKAWDAVAGSTVNLAGGTGEIYLPLVPGDALKTVSPTDDTKIGFSATILSNNPALAGVSITVPANSLFADNGARGGKVGIAPVAPDRLPGPLPAGLEFPLVITVQTDGPQNFDRPVPVRFPNLPDPITGDLLPPGERTVLWSFSHDTGQWEPQGTMTVSADGLYVDSDPGVGILQPGWHGVFRAALARWLGTSPQCLDKYLLTLSKVAECSVGLVDVIPGGCLVRSFVTTAVFNRVNCVLGDCQNITLFDSFETAIGCVPEVGAAYSLLACTRDAKSRTDDWMKCEFGYEPPPPPLLPDNIFEEQQRLTDRLKRFYDTLLDNPKWTETSLGDVHRVRSIFDQLTFSIRPNSDGGSRVTQQECASMAALPLPSNVLPTDVIALCNRIDQFVRGDLSQINVAALRATAAELGEIADTLSGRGWTTIVDSYTRGTDWLRMKGDLAVSAAHTYAGKLPYTVGRIHGVFQGQLSCVILAPNTSYQIAAGFAGSGGGSGGGGTGGSGNGSAAGVAMASFQTGPPGTCVTIPRTLFQQVVGPDFDQDGIPDDVERIYGTSLISVDSDDDGIPDSVEIEQGTDPLDGRPVITGIIASSASSGIATDVAALDGLIAIADGSAGVSVFSAVAGENPLRLAQVPTAGEAVAVASSANFITAAIGDAGLAIIDTSIPANARIVHQVGVGALGDGSAQAVAAAGGLAFVGTKAGEVAVVELISGAVFQIMDLGAKVEDVAIEGTTLYAYAGDRLHVLPFGGGILERVGVVTCPSPIGINSANGRGRLFVGGGIAYATHSKGYNALDVRDPANPALLSTGNSPQFGWKHTVANGSGTVLAAFSTDQAFDRPQTHNIGLFDSTKPTEGDMDAKFLTQFDTPGIARAVTLYNGLAYVADHNMGLSVINYQPPDTAKRAPTGTLEQSVTGQVTIGGFVVLRAAVQDDVQVRNVEFFANGQRVAVDGNFPFEHIYRVPTGSVGTAITFSAMATDMGGNRLGITNTPIVTKADDQPPTVTIESPTAGASFALADSLFVRVSAIDNVDGVAVSGIRLELDGVPVAARRLSRTDFQVTAPTTRGSHSLRAVATDSAGNTGNSTPVAFTVYAEAVSREWSVYVAEPAKLLGEAVSREWSVFVPENPRPLGEAISREWSVYVPESPNPLGEAISREWSVYVAEPVRTIEAISREWSVEVKDPAATGNKLRAKR